MKMHMSLISVTSFLRGKMRLGALFQRCPGAKCEMTGAMPTDFLLFEVGEEPAEESVDDEENVAPDSQNKWTINNR